MLNVMLYLCVLNILVTYQGALERELGGGGCCLCVCPCGCRRQRSYLRKTQSLPFTAILLRARNMEIVSPDRDPGRRGKTDAVLG